MVNLSYRLTLSPNQLALLFSLAQGPMPLGGADGPDTLTLKALLGKGFAKTRTLGRKKAEQESVAELTTNGKRLALIVKEDAVALAVLARKA